VASREPLRSIASTGAFLLACAGCAFALAGPQPPAPAATRYLGTASCARSSCHGAGQGDRGAEYTRWIRDPHAAAFEALQTTRSALMVARLGRQEDAWHNETCLACHAVNSPPELAGPRFAISEGVSCEACHGAAEGWQALHVRPEWHQMDPVAKARRGMRDTTTLVARWQLCVDCHVGGPGRSVDHEMLAAGHPPLRFDAGAYDELWPRHSRRRAARAADSAERARVWLVGQAQTLRAQLELAKTSIERGAWPEFATYDCRDCHHPLSGSSGTPRAGRAPGALTWNRRSISLFDSLSLQDPQLGRETWRVVDAAGRALQVASGNPADALAAATEASAALDDLCRRVEQEPLSASRLAAWMAAAARGESTAADRRHDAPRIHNAVRSVYASYRAAPGGARDLALERAIEAVRLSIAPPDGRGVNEARSTNRLTDLQRHVIENYGSGRSIGSQP